MNKYITLFSLGLLAISCTSKTDQSKFYYDMAGVYGESVYWPDTSNARILKDNYSDLNNAQFIDKLYELMGDSEGQIHAFVLIYSDRTQRKINYAVAKAFNHPYDKSTSSTGQQVYTTVTYLSEANSSVTPTPVGMTKKELIAENPKQNIKTESIPEELLDFITDKNKQLFVRDKKIIGLNLEGKKALIFGSTSGIGKAIALAYSQAGAKVGCLARTAREIEATVQEIEEKEGQAIAIQTDVTDHLMGQNAIEKVFNTYKKMDIMVINAGVSLDKNSVEKSDPENWKAVLNINLVGAYNCAQAVIPHFKENGEGKIITVGSGLGRRGEAGNSAYCCSKAGLWMLTRLLGEELLPYNISVNELIPGPVNTFQTRNRPQQDGDVVFSNTEWIKQPEDVVPLALFLATQPTIGPTAQSFSLMRRNNG